MGDVVLELIALWETMAVTSLFFCVNYKYYAKVQLHTAKYTHSYNTVHLLGSVSDQGHIDLVHAELKFLSLVRDEYLQVYHRPTS